MQIYLIVCITNNRECLSKTSTEFLKKNSRKNQTLNKERKNSVSFALMSFKTTRKYESFLAVIFFILDALTLGWFKMQCVRFVRRILITKSFNIIIILFINLRIIIQV